MSTPRTYGTYKIPPAAFSGFSSTNEMYINSTSYYSIILSNDGTGTVVIMETDINSGLQSQHTFSDMDVARNYISSVSATPCFMTDKEREELGGLRAEKEKWIKEQKLNVFKELPSHIRQKIVDESYMISARGKFDIQQRDFPDFKRLNELEGKESLMNNWPPYSYLASATDDCNNYHTPPSQYSFIFNVFNTKELVEAHIDATLEESIAE